MNLKSHFQFSRKQRSGIFLLLAIILILQCVYFFIEMPSQDISIDQQELEQFQKEIDSLKVIEIQNRTPVIYPFNPNFITDYKGYTLGMTTTEIDRLLKFRNQDKWINSVAQFQQVTKVSDTLLDKISPYFKFPEWVTQPRSKQNLYSNTPKTIEEKFDLNSATAVQLQIVNGIGETLSNRIIKFRERFQGGFIHHIQLQDVYGLTPEVIERLTNRFVVKTPRKVIKFNLNKITTEELVTIQHIDYELAFNIIEQRTLRQGYTSIDELTKVKGFPEKKIDIIKLYLTL